MKALIVDDERLARAELLRLLKPHAEIVVVGEAVNADDAVEKIDALAPDLLFLDIQMPGRNGFELLEMLDNPPAVIFTTAYDDYAIKAFEVNALDYLLKPIEPGRLASALARAIERAAPVASRSGQGTTFDDGQQIFIRDGGRCWFVRLGDIRLLESEGNYTRVYFSDQKPLLLRTLNHLESRLDGRRFFRASRKYIINLSWIESVEPSLAGGLAARFADGTRVEISRRRARFFRDMTQL